MRVLGNYQVGKTNTPFRASSTDTRVAFIQRAGRGGQGWGGQGLGASRGDTPGNTGADAARGRGSIDLSTIIGGSRGDTPKTNSRGELHCYNCGAVDHWAYKCSHLSNEQQKQLHMKILDAQDEVEEVQEKEHQLLNVTFAQEAALPETWHTWTDTQ